MPARKTVEQVNADMERLGKAVRAIVWGGRKGFTEATCLTCNEPFEGDGIGETMYDIRAPYGGCPNCGDNARNESKRRYDMSEVPEIIRENFENLTLLEPLEEGITINDTVVAGCVIHPDQPLGSEGDGRIPLRYLIDQNKLAQPCTSCDSRGAEPLTWEEVEHRLSQPGVMPETMSPVPETYVRYTAKMRFTCSVEGHDDFEMQPKSVVLQGQGCKLCGALRQAQLQRRTTADIEAAMVEAQGGRHTYPNLEEEHGGFGTGTYSQITVQCQHGHVFTRTIESELNGAGCVYCPNTRRSQTEVEISFELGQFDPSWDPFDTQIQGVPYRLSMADMKFFNGMEIVEYDPEWVHSYRDDRFDADCRKTAAAVDPEQGNSTVVRIRENRRDGTPQPEVPLAINLHVGHRATVKEIVNTVLQNWIERGRLGLTDDIAVYLAQSHTNRHGEARAWYSTHLQSTTTPEDDTSSE